MSVTVKLCSATKKFGISRALASPELVYNDDKIEEIKKLIAIGIFLAICTLSIEGLQ